MTYKKTKKRMLKEGSEDGSLFSSSNLNITREGGTLKFDFSMPGWWHDSEDPSEAIAIIAGSKYKSEPEILQIELTDADKAKIDIAEFLYWMSGGNKYWSPGGQNDLTVEWEQVEPVLVKKFGANYLQELKFCDTLGDMLKFYLGERDGFIQDFYELASDEGWTDDEEDYSQEENIRKPIMKKITESKKVSINKKVRATLKRIIKEEYNKVFKENRGRTIREDQMSDAVRELTLYADNDERLYRALMDNYLKNMVVKKKRGVYDHNLAIKLLEYYYQNYVRPAYKKEFGDDIKLSPQERKEFAEYYVNALEEEDDFVNAQPKNK